MDKLITLDLSICEKYQISVTALFILYGQALGKFDFIDKFVSNHDYITAITMLKDKNLTDGTHCLIKDELIVNDAFEELFACFPIQTPLRRKLKTDKVKARNEYNKAIKKNKALHLLVLRCLELEIQDRNKHNQMEYMCNIYKWVKNKYWEVYIEFLDKPELMENSNTERFSKLVL